MQKVGGRVNQNILFYLREINHWIRNHMHGEVRRSIGVIGLFKCNKYKKRRRYSTIQGVKHK